MACVVWKNSEKTTQVGTHLGGEKTENHRRTAAQKRNLLCF